MSIIPYLFDPHRLLDLSLSPKDLFDKPLRTRDCHKSSKSVPVALPSTDKDKFQINLDVQHFSPEEINVKIADRHVVVEGKHDEKLDEHGYIARRFVRRYALPEGCLPDTVKATLSSDGVLTISAPKKLPLPDQGEKIVPIQYTGPIQKKLVSADKEHEDKTDKNDNVSGENK